MRCSISLQALYARTPRLKPMKLVSCIPTSLLSRAVALALAMSCSLAQADAYSAVEKLIQSGQSALALDQLDAKIKDAPRDPQWRFLQGVAQMNEGQSAQATATFEKLVQDYPELPEPYNNLAVLYAQNNDLEKASRALQDAIRANPSYATAYENLGDIYIRLAEKALSQASQMAPAQQARLQPKISSLRLLVTRARPPEATPVTSSSIAPADKK